jgi:ubiquinone/menaquinone biosynthesis C-methylase UbiE
MTFQGKKKHRSYQNVKKFWENEGFSRGESPFATIRDHYYRLIEITNIINFLKEKKIKNILDVGCGNGISTFYFSPIVKKIIGIDYSNNLIKQAKNFQKQNNFKKIIKKCNYNLKSSYNNITFKKGNVLDLNEYKNKFQCVISSRVLINLPNYDSQDQALKNIYKSLTKGGYLILHEVVKDYHSLLSEIREKFSLSPLEVYWHNLYLNEESFKNSVKKIGFKLEKKFNYGVYQILSKVIYPNLIKPEEPNFLSNFNKFSAELFMKNKKLGLEIINFFANKKINKKDIDNASHQTGYILKKI